MKKPIIILFFSFLSLGLSAQLSIVKSNPLSVFEGFVGVCFEKTLSAKSSYQLSAFVGYDLDEIEGIATALGIGYRIYITKKDAPRGFYLMPHVGGVYTDSSTAVNLGLDLGYQWMWGNNIVMDAALGPNYYENLSTNTEEFFDGGELKFVLAFGYAF